MNNTYYTDDYCYGRTICEPRPLPAGHRRLERAKPRTYCHYSNDASQGALIAQTTNWPDSYDPTTTEHSSAYSDRLRSWDAKRYARTCELAGTGEQGWSGTLPKLNNQALVNFAQWALNLPCKPIAVRVIHYFNVSNGYSCPVVEALYPKAA